MVSDKGNILLVDDDVDVRESIRDALSDEGYATLAASDGYAALDYLRAHPAPPLILLDWNMPRMNGSEFMEEVAKDATLSQIPVVLLTADMKAPEKAKTRHFASYLVKPINLDALFEVVGRYCNPADP